MYSCISVSFEPVKYMYTFVFFSASSIHLQTLIISHIAQYRVHDKIDLTVFLSFKFNNSIKCGLQLRLTSLNSSLLLIKLKCWILFATNNVKLYIILDTPFSFHVCFITKHKHHSSYGWIKRQVTYNYSQWVNLRCGKQYVS